MKLHSPQLVVENRNVKIMANSIVILLITEKTEQVMLNCFQEIAARGANIIIFTNSLQILGKLQNKLGEKLDIIFIETLKYYSEIRM